MVVEAGRKVGPASCKLEISGLAESLCSLFGVSCEDVRARPSLNGAPQESLWISRPGSHLDDPRCLSRS